MVDVKDEGKVLESSELAWESRSVLNPGCVQIDEEVQMFYRAIGSDGKSRIGYCRVLGNKVVERGIKPVIEPEFDYESEGVEDPRIVKFEDKYLMFYTAFDGKSARVAYAVSSDLRKWEKKGVISAEILYRKARDMFAEQKLDGRYTYFEGYYELISGKDVNLWQKDAFLFPRRIKGKMALMYRILPGIQIIYFDDWQQLNNDYWLEYLKTLDKHIIMDPVFPYESRNIGGGCPPIETKYGWLYIYHGVDEAAGKHVYTAGAALADLENPQKIIGRLPYPLFAPEQDWEKQGEVNNVVFPTGTAMYGERLWIYYGAADRLIAAKSVSLQQLLLELKYACGNT